MGAVDDDRWPAAAKQAEELNKGLLARHSQRLSRPIQHKFSAAAASEHSNNQSVVINFACTLYSVAQILLFGFLRLPYTPTGTQGTAAATLRGSRLTTSSVINLAEKNGQRVTAAGRRRHSATRSTVARSLLVAYDQSAGGHSETRLSKRRCGTLGSRIARALLLLREA